jgi:hypothetical protein
VLEGHGRTDLVEDVHPWWQSRLERVLHEQAPGERMQSPDGGPIELVEGEPAPASLDRARIPLCPPFNLPPVRSRSSSAAQVGPSSVAPQGTARELQPWLAFGLMMGMPPSIWANAQPTRASNNSPNSNEEPGRLRLSAPPF